MNKIFFAKISLMLLLIFLLNKSQIVMAQTNAASADISKTTAASIDVTSAATASADVSKSVGVSADAPKATDQPLQPDQYARKLRVRTGDLFNRIDYRAIKYIKWPQEKLKNAPPEDSPRNVEEEKNRFDKYCRMFALQYASEAEKSLGLAKGSMPLNHICDLMQVALKSVNNVEDLAFEVAGAWMLNEFDRELFRQYHSPVSKNNKIYNKSFFGIVGLPAHYSDFVMQILVMLSLILNFFLLYKVLRER